MSLIPWLILLFVIGGAVAYVVTLYNGLIAVKNNVDKAWANIDVLLKQRHDELPTRRSLQRLHEVRAGHLSACHASAFGIRAGNHHRPESGSERESDVRHRPADRDRRELSGAEGEQQLHAIAIADHRARKRDRRPARSSTTIR